MRTVIIGKPNKIEKVLPKDLPKDNDLNYSFWRWVDFSGLDLSDYNIEDMDIIDSIGDNSILPDAIGNLVSRRTTWKNAKLPQHMPTGLHDLVAEAVNQTDLVVGSFAKEWLNTYTGSWSDGIPGVDKLLGGVEWRIEFLNKFKLMFPRLAQRMVWQIETNQLVERPAKREIANIVFDKVWFGDEYLDLKDDLGSSKDQYDRWAYARLIEKLLDTKSKQAEVYVHSLYPEPLITVIPPNSINPNEAKKWIDA
jgi:hypothetical protein